MRGLKNRRIKELEPSLEFPNLPPNHESNKRIVKNFAKAAGAGDDVLLFGEALLFGNEFARNRRQSLRRRESAIQSKSEDEQIRVDELGVSSTAKVFLILVSENVTMLKRLTRPSLILDV